MDSRLDQIFRTSFRQTESADTWMGIRREEPQNPHERKKKHEGDKEKPVWEDEAVVSIAALKQFLTSLIAPTSPYMPPSAAGSAHGPAGPLSVQQQQAHHAAQAYQNTARHAPAAPIPPPSEPPRLEIGSSSPTLSTEENRTIHQVLSLLDQLLAEGIDTLAIQKEGSFLESLKRSAEAALAGPQR